MEEEDKLLNDVVGRKEKEAESSQSRTKGMAVASSTVPAEEHAAALAAKDAELAALRASHLAAMSVHGGGAQERQRPPLPVTAPCCRRQCTPPH